MLKACEDISVKEWDVLSRTLYWITPNTWLLFLHRMIQTGKGYSVKIESLSQGRDVKSGGPLNTIASATIRAQHAIHRHITKQVSGIINQPLIKIAAKVWQWMSFNISTPNKSESVLCPLSRNQPTRHQDTPGWQMWSEHSIVLISVLSTTLRESVPYRLLG